LILICSLLSETHRCECELCDIKVFIRRFNRVISRFPPKSPAPLKPAVFINTSKKVQTITFPQVTEPQFHPEGQSLFLRSECEE